MTFVEGILPSLVAIIGFGFVALYLYLMAKEE